MFEDKFSNVESDLLAKIEEIVNPAIAARDEAQTKLNNLEEKFREYRTAWDNFEWSKKRRIKEIADIAASGGDVDAARQALRDEETEAKEKFEISNVFERTHLPAAKQLLEKRKDEVVNAYRESRKQVHQKYVAEVKLMMDELLAIDENWQAVCNEHVSGTSLFFLPRPVAFKAQMGYHYESAGLKA
ncbi:MAG TPA: hypothetical protein DCS48_06955 [Desulfovibrio sp.]|nr:hypothetical protein [Desulfovibrio sp.]